jgi:hypothetical protein
MIQMLQTYAQMRLKVDSLFFCVTVTIKSCSHFVCLTNLLLSIIINQTILGEESWDDTSEWLGLIKLTLSREVLQAHTGTQAFDVK